MSFFIREDPLTGYKSIIASTRSRRPHLLRESIEEEPFQCPFCPGNETLTPEESLRIEDEDGWIVRVIPNKFPAIPYMHDVIIDFREHTSDLDKMPHLSKLLWVYKERLKHFYTLDGVKYVSLFRNKGKSAGASIPHPHSQIVGMPFYPTRFLREKEKYKNLGDSLMLSFLEGEISSQERIVHMSRNFCVLMAYAPITPYEVWIVPRRKIPSFIFEDSLDELADVLKKTVRFLKFLLGSALSYNVTFQSAPPWDGEYHYYIRIMPRLSVFGGFELGTGDVIIPVAPEEAASELRSVIYEEAVKVGEGDVK